jgi:hypothetical protein
MKRLAALSLAALSLAACSGEDKEAADVVAETADNLERIESGEISMRLVVTPKGGEAEAFGFELRGPFSLDGPGELPVARIAYTQISGSERGTVTVVSTGRKAYVEEDGQAYELRPEQAAQLRLAGEELDEGEGLGELGIDDWIKEPELSDSGVGDTETDRIDAKLDVATAAQDLVELSRGLGQGTLGDLSDADDQTIERATQPCCS